MTFSSDPVLYIANVLVIVGALNWLAIGLSNTNYVTQLFDTNAKHIFTLVGLAGAYLAYKMITDAADSTEKLTPTEILQMYGKKHKQTRNF